MSVIVFLGGLKSHVFHKFQNYSVLRAVSLLFLSPQATLCSLAVTKILPFQGF
jgi:hypothetical protein